MRTEFNSGMTNSFWSVGIGGSEIDKIHLYTNRWILVNNLEISAVNVY